MAEGNYILTGDFNVNLHSSNRIATTASRLDPSRLILADKLRSLIDTQTLAVYPSI